MVHDRKGWHRAWRFTRLGLLVVLGPAGHRGRGGMDLAQADRRRLYPRRTGAARRPGDLHARPRRLPHPAGQQPRHRRSRQSRPRRVRRAIIQMRIKWNGSVEVYRIVARGVRLKGGCCVGQGQLGADRQAAAAAERQAVPLPDLAVDLADTTDCACARPTGRWASRSTGAAICPAGSRAGWRPRAAAGCSAPAGSTSSAPSSTSPSSPAGRRSRARSAPGAFACPASNLRWPSRGMEIDSSFTEAFDSFDGSGRLTDGLVRGGRQWPGERGQQSDLQGHADRTLGRIDLARSRRGWRPIVAGPHPFRRPLPARCAAPVR